MSDYLASRACIGDSISFTGPNGSFFLRESDQPGVATGRWYGVGSDAVDASLASGREQPAQGPPRLRRQHRRRSGGSRRDPRNRLCSTQDSPGITASRIKPRAPTTRAMSRASSNRRISTTVTSRCYLCGPPPMVEAVRTHVTEAGIEPTGFYYEKFALRRPSVVHPSGRIFGVRARRAGASTAVLRGRTQHRRSGRAAATRDRRLRRLRAQNRRRQGHPIHRRPAHGARYGI